MDNYIKYLYGNDELKKTFKFILETNNSWNNAYHNNHHLLNVFNNVMKISIYYDLDKKERTILGIAALFHDYNHSGGKLKDDENIKISTDSMLKFIGDELPNIDTNEIVNLISITEFPHKREPKTINEEIMIDSDLNLIFQIDDWFNNIVVALSIEFGNDILTQIDLQIGFMNNIKFYTNYAQKIQGENTNSIISELKYLKTIFE